MPAHKKQISFSVDENGCHICTSHAKNKAGYAVFRHPKRPQSKCLIHRYVYSINNLCGDEIPNGLLVRHKCDNPACINPLHLELGTHLDNAKDKITRGRDHDKKGENNGHNKLKTIDVINIFNSNIPRAEIAISYGISVTNVAMIKRKQTWSHVTKDL